MHVNAYVYAHIFNSISKHFLVLWVSEPSVAIWLVSFRFLCSSVSQIKFSIKFPFCVIDVGTHILTQWVVVWLTFMKLFLISFFLTLSCLDSHKIFVFVFVFSHFFLLKIFICGSKAAASFIEFAFVRLLRFSLHLYVFFYLLTFLFLFSLCLLLLYFVIIYYTYLLNISQSNRTITTPTTYKLFHCLELTFQNGP